MFDTSRVIPTLHQSGTRGVPLLQRSVLVRDRHVALDAVMDDAGPTRSRSPSRTRTAADSDAAARIASHSGSRSRLEWNARCSCHGTPSMRLLAYIRPRRVAAPTSIAPETTTADLRYIEGGGELSSAPNGRQVAHGGSVQAACERTVFSALGQHGGRRSPALLRPLLAARSRPVRDARGGGDEVARRARPAACIRYSVRGDGHRRHRR